MPAPGAFTLVGPRNPPFFPPGPWPLGIYEPSPYPVGVAAFADGDAVATVTPDVSAVTIQTNDILLASASLVGGVMGDVITAPGGEGWTSALSKEEPSGVNAYLIWFWKRWGEGFTDDPTPTFTQTGSVAGGFSVGLTVWRGCRVGARPYDDVKESTAVVGPPCQAPTAQSFGTFRTTVRAFAWNAASAGYLTTPDEGTPLYTGQEYSTTSGVDRAISSSYLVRTMEGFTGSMDFQGTGGPGMSVGMTMTLAPFGSVLPGTARYRRPLLGVGF